MDFALDLSNIRARRARYLKVLSGKWVSPLLLTVMVLSLLGGVYSLASGSSLGWLVLWPANICLLLLLWLKFGLERESFGNFKTPKQIYLHEALELGTLSRLNSGKELSAYDVWKALEGSEEHYFIQNRYLIDSSFFEQLLSKNPESAYMVWSKAAGLQEKYQAPGYTNMLVLVALVASVPDIDQVLRRVKLDPSDIETSVPWMIDIHAKRELARQKKYFGGIGRDWAYGYTPILGTLGVNISRGIEQHGFFRDTSMHGQIVGQMTQIMSSGNTITLVGDAGVGKTTCVYAFADKLLADPNLPKQIRYHQIVQLDASSLIANAKNPGQLEDLMIQILNEAHRAKNIILFFDEAQVFFGTGTGTVDLSHVLQPAFESNTLKLIFAMTPQNWQKLSGSGAVSKLQPVNIPSASEKDTLSVLRDQIALLEYRHNIVFTYQALQESYKLGNRYVSNQSMPGAALSVLDQTAALSKSQLITRELVQQAVEQAYSVKLQTAEGNESSDLLQLEDKLRQYVISQDRAVTVVANALRRSRSGVGNPDRPIGTFLFLGPTGVGKTELSKALARVYFGDEKALIRVDMNQYVKSGDVERLITPMQGDELGFLGEVRKQPFSVILLDEIEKAHSSVVNALLQALDEGVMRDSENKAVSFRDAIIIATSNAGADEIRQMLDDGKDLAKLESTFVDNLISRGDFKPEFINRFDEVVLFKPLSQDELIKVIDLILTGINKTLDPQKVRVELSENAKKWLVEKGYDSKLGARPMRRMAQRYVENIIAKRLLDQSVQPGGVVQLDVADFEQSE